MPTWLKRDISIHSKPFYHSKFLDLRAAVLSPFALSYGYAYMTQPFQNKDICEFGVSHCSVQSSSAVIVSLHYLPSKGRLKPIKA